MKDGLIQFGTSAETSAGNVRHWTCGLLAAVCILFASSRVTLAQDLEIILPEINGEVGEEVTIAIEAANIADKGIAAFVVGIQYDSSILSNSFSATTEGTIAAGVAPSEFEMDGEYRVIYARSLTDPIDEDGVLVYVTTTVLAEGTTDLTVSPVSYLENSSGTVDYVTVNGSFSTEVTNSDPDGIPDEIEDDVPSLGGDGTGDGNGDGIPDSEQENVASLLNGGGASYVTIASASGTQLVNVTASATLPEPLPASVQVPDGVLEFQVENVEVGGATTVTIYTSQEVNSYFKYGPTPDNPTAHWYLFDYDGETGAEVQDGQITLHLVDGARGDGDLTANGVIEDPGAPADYENLGTSAPREELPDAFALHGNYPNPFNPSTTVRFDLPATADVSIEVYDILGRQVLALPATPIEAGADRSLRVEASELTSGVYIYRVVAQAGSETMVRAGRMTVIK